MPLPTTLTELQLATYLVSKTVLGSVADALGWSVGDSDPADWQPIIDDALTLYGVDAIEDAADVGRLRVAARYCGWKAAVQATASQFSFSTDGQVFTRSQLQTMAQAAYTQAVQDARAAGLVVSESPASITGVTGDKGRQPLLRRGGFAPSGAGGDPMVPLVY